MLIDFRDPARVSRDPRLPAPLCCTSFHDHRSRCFPLRDDAPVPNAPPSPPPALLLRTVASGPARPRRRGPFSCAEPPKIVPLLRIRRAERAPPETIRPSALRRAIGGRKRWRWLPATPVLPEPARCIRNERSGRRRSGCPSVQPGLLDGAVAPIAVPRHLLLACRP